MSDQDSADIQSLFRPNIALMEGYTPGQQPKTDGFIKLNTNENPYPPSPKVVEAIMTELDGNGERLRLYPEPTGIALREAAAERFDFPLDGIMCGNGSDELLTIVTRAFAGARPRGGILTPYPTYTLYRTLSEIEHSNFQTVDFPEDYSLPDGIEMIKSRILFLANPNSPSGTMIDPASIRALAEKLSGVLVVDEAYVDFSDADCLGVARDMRNVIVLRSFSKSYSLAGLRVGLAFGHPALIEGLMKVKDSYNLDRLAIVGATAALRDSAHMLENRRKILDTRARLQDGLAGLGMSVLSSHANFVLAQVPDMTPPTDDDTDDAEESPTTAKRICDALADRRILVRYFDARRLKNSIRITVGTDDEIDTLLAAIKEIQQNLEQDADIKGGQARSDKSENR